MTTLDITHMSIKERLDLIGELCDSLTAEAVTLTPAQEAELVQRVAALEYANDDLAWAKPYVDEAIAEVELGKAISIDEHNARMDTLLKKLSTT